MALQMEDASPDLYPTVVVREEGMRDGLQIERMGITTDEKLQLLNKLVDAGEKRIMVGSFVSPKWTPQMADIDEFVSRIEPREGVTYLALALNERGHERLSKWVPPLTVFKRPETLYHLDEIFLKRNSNRTSAQEQGSWAATIEKAKSSGATEAGIGISSGWGSNWAGELSRETRMAGLKRQYDAWTAAGIPVTKILLNDPMGWNTPVAVSRDIQMLKRLFPSVTHYQLHLHNTRGMALTSAYAAITALGTGYTIEFDTGIGGIGGCPYCGNGQAAGMIPTEDLVQLTDSMGIETGIDIHKLVEAAILASKLVGRELDGRVALAGPLPDRERLYDLRVPYVQTFAEAQHFRLGPETYQGNPRPWEDRDSKPVVRLAPISGESTVAGPAAAPRARTSVSTGPLRDIRVLELTHVVAGPSAGQLLADMGAEIIRVDRPDGGHPRGPTKAAFAFLNRNKKSVAIDLKTSSGKAAFMKLVETADVIIDNFAPGVLDRLGLSYEALSGANPRIICLAIKGFLPGPFEKRPLLDEPAQIMGGLAYMTGPEGNPLRVGASVVDIGAAAYGAAAVLAALHERERTGVGQNLTAGLFETVVYWNGIAMADSAWAGEKCVPYPSMPQDARFGWGVYRLFETIDDGKVFVGITSNAHWDRFCQEFDFAEFHGDPRLATNLDRAEARSWFIPILAERLKRYSAKELEERLLKIGVPCARLQRPDELFSNPQLMVNGQLVGTPIPEYGVMKLPSLPVRSNTYKPEVGARAPGLGEHTEEVLKSAGLDTAAIAQLEAEGTILKGQGLPEQWETGPI